ncbi:MAG: polysaccharide biosynthesis/export family protein [Verrucomicrobiota bacterium JB023]|nr:polysaccharide biosynthesis/export family protein [Verrucomicrobiota bacterium JB023]
MPANLRNLLILLALSFASPLAGQQDDRIEGGATGIIQTHDTVSITVFREPDLDTTGRLGQGGSITMPLIGQVGLVGLTTEAAEKAIEAKLFDGYLVDPDVRVRIVARPVQTVSVNGQVKNAGLYKIPTGQSLTLVQAISMAGGLTEIANPSSVTIVRAKTGKSYKVNLKAIMRGQQRDVTLTKDDVITVPESWF